MAGARVGTCDVAVDDDDGDKDANDAEEQDFEKEQCDKDEFLVLATLLLCFISCKRETGEKLLNIKLYSYKVCVVKLKFSGLKINK